MNVEDFTVYCDCILGDRCAHFSIYDGHGGRLAAEYAQKHLHANVLSAGLPRELVCVLFPLYRGWSIGESFSWCECILVPL